MLLVLATPVILWAGRGIGFIADEWGWISGAAHPSASWVLMDYNGHLQATTMLLYWALLHTFGIPHVLAFRLLAIVLHFAVVVALFVLIRRRLGVWPALVGALVIAVLGTGADAFLTALEVPILCATAAALGALIALESDTRRTDAVACALLIVALASFSNAVAFTAGVFVELLIRRRDWRRLWVPVIPTVLYLAWRFHWAASSNGVSGAGSPLDVVVNAYRSATGALAGLAGIQLNSPTLRADVPWLPALVAVAVGLGTLLLVALIVHRRRVDPRLANVVVVGGVLWLLTALFRGAHGGLYPSRYVYMGAVVVLLIISSALRQKWLTGFRAQTVLAGAVAVSASLNIAWMVVWGNHLRRVSGTAQAQLAAVELARGVVPASYRASSYATGGIRAGQYFASLRSFGEPDLSPVDRLRSAPESDRESADRVLVQAGSVRLRVGAAVVGGSPPRPERVVGGTVAARGSCLVLAPTARVATIDLLSSPRPIVLELARGADAFVLARRFGEAYVGVGGVSGAPGADTLAARTAGDPKDPWRIRVIATGPTGICGH